MQRNKARLIGVIITAVAVALLIGGVIVFFVTHPFSPAQNTTDTTAPAAVPATPAQAHSTAPSTAKSGEAVTGVTAPSAPAPSGAENTVPSTKQEAAVPSSLQALLAAGGCSAEELQSSQINQLVVVDSSGSTAEITFYQHGADGWKQEEALTCQGFIGMNGTTSAMSEGSVATPQGLYHIGSAFYQDDMPATGLESFAITEDTYWVDDPDSPHYNQRVTGAAEQDWNSAEHMSEIATYRYGFVIEYNMPPTGHARGSAIFFHLSDGDATHGCISADEDMVLAYLAKLSAAQNPYILIL